MHLIFVLKLGVKVNLGARQRSCGALHMLEKAFGHACESSASTLALLLHLWLVRVRGVESEGGGSSVRSLSMLAVAALMSHSMT
jgi:hypothetical protein